MALFLGQALPGIPASASPVPCIADYPTLQAAIDANPGKMILVPPGDYLIEKKLRIASNDSGLYGYGRIIQCNTNEAILEVEHARGVRIRDIALTRPEGKKDSAASGLYCWDSQDLTLDGVRVLDNRAREGAIEIRNCTRSTIQNCEITNYKRIAVDDRTDSEHYGYAFFAIDGTGIMVRDSLGTTIRDNRIIEQHLFPTREMKEKYRLGQLTSGRKPTFSGDLAKGVLERGYVNNWHQGSAILVTGPEKTDFTTITGNYIENSAQGIDLHSDHVLCSHNTVHYGMMGIKATHGCRNLIITGNQLSRIDLWGILLNPGALSHAAEPAKEGKPPRGANVDAGTLVAENIISDYGYGHEFWNWGGSNSDHNGSFAIALFEGQLPTNPPLRDILIRGNIVYDTGRDQVLVEGRPQTDPPRYRYAVYVGPWSEGAEKGPTFPVDIHFQDNLLHPGTKGISNIELSNINPDCQ